jgi:multimeric flavodoxin WrbA
MNQIAIVYHSGYGHTARQAEAVARGVRSSAGALAHLIRAEEVEQHWPTLAAADGIMFGAPTQGPEHGPTPADLRTAEHLGRRVAQAAARWQLGQPASAAA